MKVLPRLRPLTYRIRDMPVCDIETADTAICQLLFAIGANSDDQRYQRLVDQRRRGPWHMERPLGSTARSWSRIKGP